MKLQNYEQKSVRIRADFERLKNEQPEKLIDRINLSWSNWGFGLENLKESVQRLANNQVNYIEITWKPLCPQSGI